MLGEVRRDVFRCSAPAASTPGASSCRSLRVAAQLPSVHMQAGEYAPYTVHLFPMLVDEGSDSEWRADVFAHAEVLVIGFLQIVRGGAGRGLKIASISCEGSGGSDLVAQERGACLRAMNRSAGSCGRGMSRGRSSSRRAVVELNKSCGLIVVRGERL